MLRIFPYDTEGVAQAIEAFEKEYKVSLPEKYKEFLLKYNGGNSLQTSFSVNRQSSNIRAFYGFNKADYYNNFKFLIDKDFLNAYLEMGYLPFAKDNFGNDLIIGIADKNYNQVAFLDHEEQKIKPLKVNFEEFLSKIKSKIYKVKSIEERIQRMKEVGSPIVVDDELISIWQEDIDKYSGREQVIVKL